MWMVAVEVAAIALEGIRIEDADAPGGKREIVLFGGQKSTKTPPAGCE